MRERITDEDLDEIVEACREGMGETLWLTPFGWVIEVDGRWVQVNCTRPLRDDGSEIRRAVMVHRG